MLRNLPRSSGESSSANLISDSSSILPYHRSFWKSPGFTALELVVAIAIIAILLAVAIPAYTGYLDRIKLQTTLDLIIADLRNTQQKAKAMGVKLAVEFNPNQNTQYRIYQFSMGPTLESKTIPNGVRIDHTTMTDFPPNSLIYYPAFSQSETDGGTIYLASPGGRKAKIVVATITGRIRVEFLP